MLAPWKESLDKLRQCIKKQRHHFADKGLSSQSYGFSSSHVQMWELDHKEGWVPKNWCFQTVVLEKTLESPLDCKEIQPFQLMLKLKLQYFGYLMQKSRLTGKDPDAGKDWGLEEKGVTEDDMVGWHHQHDGHEFEQAPRDSEAWHTVDHGVAKTETWLNGWVTTTTSVPILGTYFLPFFPFQ